MSNRFILNETSYQGRGSRIALVKELKIRELDNILVVSDETLVKANVLEKVTSKLDEGNIKYEVFTNIKPNPTVNNVKDGLAKCEAMNAKAIVAVGGGSVIDTAKAIAVIMTNKEYSDVVSLAGAVESKNKCLPLVAIPTTHGTGAEVTINFVITDEEKEVKMVCVNTNDIPHVAIIDSELMESLPKSVAATTGMDALTHAIEGYITKGAWDLSDMYHLEAIKLIYANLEKAVNEKDEKAIENMSLAQYIAGMGFSNVGLGIVHSLAHQLGAVYDTPHGLANAILLPHVMKFNGEVAYERFRKILVFLGEDAKYMPKERLIERFIEKINELKTSVGITQTLKDVGVKEEDIKMLAEKAMQDVCTPGNPREVTASDMEEIYKSAY